MSTNHNNNSDLISHHSFRTNPACQTIPNIDLQLITEEYESISSDEPEEIPSLFKAKPGKNMAKKTKSNKLKSLKSDIYPYVKLEKDISVNSRIAKDFIKAKKKKDSIYSGIIKWDEAKRSNSLKKSKAKRKRTVGDIICENHDFTSEVKEIGLSQMNSWNDNIDSTKGVTKILSSLRKKSQKKSSQDL